MSGRLQTQTVGIEPRGLPEVMNADGDEAPMRHNEKLSGGAAIRLSSGIDFRLRSEVWELTPEVASKGGFADTVCIYHKSS